MKRMLSAILALVLLVTLIPWAPERAEAADATRFFDFPNEQYSLDGAARVVSTDRVTLSGVANNVIGSTISYDVVQIYKKPVAGSVPTSYEEVIIDSREGQTGNISLGSGTSSLKINDIQLFPGINRVTFKGTQGSATVENSIYIEYRNSPSIYNLNVNLNGTDFPIQEDQTTVVYSNSTNGKDSADISITGNAPNATKVTVSVNNKSWDYTVRSTDNWKFTAAPVRVTQGKNILNIKVWNNNQMTETTRQIAFYNGQVTFYDVVVKADGGSSGELVSNPDIQAAPGKAITVEGSVIVPLKYTPADPKATPPLAADKYEPGIGADALLKYKLGTVEGNLGISSPFPTLDPTMKFITLQFSQNIGAADAGTLTFDNQNFISFSGWNFLKTPTAGTDTSATYGFTLRNNTIPYIYAINYLPGYTATSTEADLERMEGVNMENANVSSTPIGVEVLVGNSPGTTQTQASVTKLLDSKGNEINGLTLTDYYKQIATKQMFKNVTVNGVSQKYERVFLELSKLPTAGKQGMEVKVGTGSSKSIMFTSVYGPYVKYDSLYDGKVISYDTTDSDANKYLLSEVGNFKGQLFNITNTDEIEYASGSANRSVFMYVNNVLVALQTDGTDKTRFVPANDQSDPTKSDIMDALYRTGENTIKFIFRTAKNTYEQQIKFNLVPTNLPQIPVKGTKGIFPYSTSYSTPQYNDPNFVANGGAYSTKQATMNVFGTFDFIDLGGKLVDVQTKLGSMASILKDNYIFKVVIPGEKNPILWNLNDLLTDTDGKIITPEDPTSKSNGLISVVYDYDTQSFQFYLLNQTLPADGSAKVYNFFVYNSGANGPFASYRLEIRPIAVPYTIERPLSDKRIVNQNYVEVVITSPGADSVTIQKQQAEKVIFDPTNGNDTSKSHEAYRVMVYDLKANKDNKIDFTITRGTEVTKDSFTVKYVPANIPGAQVMEAMKKSHKVFDGSLNLAFTGTPKLVRTDYNAKSNFKGQVYSDNHLLFAIANPEDGVVDRHDFETLPPNFNYELTSGSQAYSGNFPSQFVKASSVYWIDPGMADDENTKNMYDPVKYGFEPFPLPNTGLPFFNLRPADRELVPLAAGSLTLSYEPSMTQDAGRLVTVLRYDNVLKQWENIGGVVDEKKHTIKVPFTKFGYYVVAKLASSFNDVVLHPYGRNAIETIYAKGVMNPVDPSGRFGTDDYLTRGEFARMLVRALDIPFDYEGEPHHFTDLSYALSSVVTGALWDFRYIETAARAGIVRGIGTSVFGPDDNIIRQDAAVMIAKTLNLKLDTNPVSVKAAVGKAFKDSAQMDYYAMPSVAAIAKKGYITGVQFDPTDPKQGYNFQPQSRLLRGDAAIIIARVMTDLKKLPKIYAN